MKLHPFDFFLLFVIVMTLLAITGLVNIMMFLEGWSRMKEVVGMDVTELCSFGIVGLAVLWGLVAWWWIRFERYRREVKER